MLLILLREATLEILGKLLLHIQACTKKSWTYAPVRDVQKKLNQNEPPFTAHVSAV